MVFDNRKVVLRLSMRRYIVLIAFVVLMVLILFTGVFNKPLFGLEKAFYVFLICGFYIMYIAITYVLNYNYFSYSDEKNKLVFRFASLRPFDNKRKAIEIHKKDFKGFKASKSVLNLKEELILLVKTSKGVANYPSISITALSSEQKSLLRASLNQFVDS